MTDAITISKPRNRDGSTGHVLAKRSVTFTEIRKYSFAGIPLYIVVTQLNCFVNACRGTGRY